MHYTIVEVLMKNITIGKLAKETSISVDTIRYYEGLGLIPRPPRTESGYRQYPEETAERLHFISKAKSVGFTLQEILHFVHLREKPGTT